ncbi:piggyBac transposable element-derived protein 4-like, partial [Acyrthosiphon pisum]|uniref:PiggyBac transposable element-derived protein domain-containing protein n=1 Tax=Acyrthosiphon pisum TaxID=7029 RepID=A0A8R2NWT0_ACYPI
MNVKKKSQNNVFIGIEDLSSDDEEIDDTDKDKDCTPTLLECNESLEDFPLDLDLFLNDENILNDDDITDNPPNISDFNFEKAGCSPEKYKLTRFREVHGSELKAFLGLLIYMGYHELPGIRLYWSNDPNFYCDRVAKVMPVKRFLKLLRCIHLNDNSKMPQRQSQEFDKLFKIRPMLSHLQEKYKTMYKPSRHLAVDESMVAFKGRSSMKQFMPLKPIKRGFKVWALADSQSGFLLNFDVIPLISKLLNDGLFACGTFRVNKKFYPKHLMKSDNKYMPGDIEYAQSKDISVMRWKDRGAKPVTLISNMHNASESTIVNRKNKKGEKIAVKCPVGITDYNKHMGGVDKFDQYMANYSISQKSRRWWLKLFYYMIDTAV